MSKFSEIESTSDKTRIQSLLEEQLSEMKNYKNDTANISNLEGLTKGKKDAFYQLNYMQPLTNHMPNLFSEDPRYAQNNSRDQSRRQLNNKKNLKMVKTLPGMDNGNTFEEFNETNYEDPKFTELNRNIELGLVPIKGYGDISPVFVEQKKEKKKQTDIENIILKLNKQPDEATLKMPNKNINMSNFKGRILQFKNCPENVKDLICSEFIKIWKDDFLLKKITSMIGVKNFLLYNFKDKMNIFFVLFDDDGDFVSTFAIDTENFSPFISHLFVNPNLRNKGFGKKSLKYGEKYVKKLGFETANLWCEESLVSYYKKNGYVVDSPLRISEKKMVWKMIKNLS